MISKLEDLTLLNSVLNMSFHNFLSTRPKLDFQFSELSLKSLLSRGDGYITELVAKWLVQFGLEPSALIDSKDVEFSRDAKKTASDGKDSEDEASVEKESVEVEEAQVLAEKDITHIILGES